MTTKLSYKLEELELINAKDEENVRNLITSLKILFEGGAVKLKNGKIMAIGVNHNNEPVILLGKNENEMIPQPHWEARSFFKYLMDNISEESLAIAIANKILK